MAYFESPLILSTQDIEQTNTLQEYFNITMKKVLKVTESKENHPHTFPTETS